MVTTVLLAVVPSLAGQAAITQRGDLRVSFFGGFAPNALPRSQAAPIAVTLGGRITTVDESLPPQLRQIEISINRQGRLNYKGLPVCHLKQIQPSTTAAAMRVCGGAKVGEGRFTANVELPQQAPFPSQGKLIAFNGEIKGRPVIFTHVYGTKPVPTSYTLPFEVRRVRGTFATLLHVSLPSVTTDVGFITGLQMTLHRRFEYRGETHSYLSAGCPAPKGFPGAVFPLARASFAFAGGQSLTSTLTDNCKVTG